MAKLQEKKNYVHYSVSQVQSRCVFISIRIHAVTQFLHLNDDVNGQINAVGTVYDE